MEMISRVLCWLVINYAIISFVEHFIHGYLMHRRRLPHCIYKLFPYLVDVFEAHAVRHHGRWYKKFNHELDPVGKEENLTIGLADTAAIIIGTTPIWLFEMWVWPAGGLMYVAMMYIHNRLWGMLHRQMHTPQDVVFKDWAVFKFLARYHFMHHQIVGQNFNVVFPGADVLMARVARPRLRDVRAMLRLGLLSPRTKRARLRLPHCLHLQDHGGLLHAQQAHSSLSDS